MKKILLVSQDAHIGGSQILLLNLAEALKKNRFEVEFLLKNGGKLLADFQNSGKTYLYKATENKTRRSQVKNIFLKRKQEDIVKPDWGKYDYVLSNTITNGDILGEIKECFSGPMASYIHELKISAATFSSNEYVKNVIGMSDHFFVPCEALRVYLEEYYKVSRIKISVLPYFMPGKVRNIAKADDTKTFTIGGSGTTDWRKGPDLFIQIASKVKRQLAGANIKFLWRGANVETLEYKKLQYDIEKLGLEGYVVFEEQSKEMDTFYNELDLFLLTSREDPYPLVVLDAARFGIPSVCFSDAGGIPEFVQASSGGTIVPYLDTSAAAAAVVDFFHDRSSIDSDGLLAQKYLVSRHQDDELICKILQNSFAQISPVNLRNYR